MKQVTEEVSGTAAWIYCPPRVPLNCEFCHIALL